MSWKKLYENELKKTVKQKWCSRGIRTESGMARQSLNSRVIAQKSTHHWTDSCTCSHICSYMSTFLEKWIGLSFPKLAYLIRSNRTDRLVFLKTRQKKKKKRIILLIKILCIFFWETVDLLCFHCKKFLVLYAFAILLKICSSSTKYKKPLHLIFDLQPPSRKD